MKKLFLAFLLSIIASSAMAQSYIGFSAGLDWVTIKNDDFSYLTFDSYDEYFSVRSRFYSISGEYYLSKKISANLNFFFTKKNFAATGGDLISIPGRMKFNSYRGVLLVKYYFYDYFYVGSGVSVNYLDNIRFCRDIGGQFPFDINIGMKYGLPFMIGCKFKNFFLEPFYLQYSWFDGINGNQKYVDIKARNAFGFQVGYQIRISKKNNTVYSF